MKRSISILYDVCESINPTYEDVNRCTLVAKSISIYMMVCGYRRFYDRNIEKLFISHISNEINLPYESVKSSIQSNSYHVLMAMMTNSIHDTGIPIGTAELISQSLFKYSYITQEALYDEYKS